MVVAWMVDWDGCWDCVGVAGVGVLWNGNNGGKFLG